MPVIFLAEAPYRHEHRDALDDQERHPRHVGVHAEEDHQRPHEERDSGRVAQRARHFSIARSMILRIMSSVAWAPMNSAVANSSTDGRAWPSASRNPRTPPASFNRFATTLVKRSPGPGVGEGWLG